MAAIAGPIAGAAAGALFSKALGPKTPKAPKLPSGLNTPGLNIGRSSKGVVNLTRSPGLTGAFGTLSNLAQTQAADLDKLLEQVAPGFSALRASRLEGLETNRSRTIGDLRENLARRRISGSSFANDTLATANLGFQQEADRIRAESFLEELDATNKLLTQRFDTLSADAQNAINQANFESTLGANFASGVQTAMTSIFQTQARLAAESAAGLGSFLEPVVSGISDSVSGFFGKFGAGDGSTLGGV